MIILRAGSMDRVIKIQQAEITIDDFGATQETWADVLTTRAQLINSSAKEFIQSFGASSVTTCIFRTRWIQGFTTVADVVFDGKVKLSNRVLYDGGIYLVKEVTEIGRRRGLELRCVMQP